MPKVIAWIYAVCGSLYFEMYMFGSEVVQQFAIGPLWLAMVIAPVVVAILVVGPIMSRIIK